MAQYDIVIREISAEMLDELGDFAHTAWGRTDILEVEVIPGQPTTQAQIELAMPEPVLAADAPYTSAIAVVIPPEPIEPLDADEDATPKARRGKA
jgi:hypothetical protein